MPEPQILRRLILDEGARVAEAIESAQIVSLVSCGMIETARVGIHGRIVERDHVLHDGDRVEIYRPLTLDPMQARRRRAGAA